METLLTIALLLNLLLFGARWSARAWPVNWRMALPPAVVAGTFGLGARLLVEQVAPDWPWLHSAQQYGILLPGLMLLPLLAGVPLGVRPGTTAFARKSNILMMLLIGVAIFGLQILIGGFMAKILRAFELGVPDYGSFGLELTIGFFGGHATSGVLGGILRDMEHADWALAQAVAVAYATFGLVVGVATGLVLLKFFGHARPSRAVDTPGAGQGPVEDLARPSSRRVFRLFVTGGLIAVASMLGLGLKIVFARLELPVLRIVPPWIFALLCGWALWRVLRDTNIGRQVDRESSGLVTGYCADIAVIAALTALPLEQLENVVFPVLLTASVGLLGTLAFVMMISYRVFASSWLERAVLMYGTGTGVYVSGLLLLRLLDPEQKSDAHPDAALAYPVIAVFSLLALPVLAAVGEEHGAVTMGLSGGLIFLVSIAAMMVAIRMKIHIVSRHL